MLERFRTIHHGECSKGGFTLLECVVALSIMMVFAGIAIPVGIRLIERERLSETVTLLTNRLRLAQSQSQVDTESSMIVLDPYQPMYTLRTVSTMKGYYGFLPGINYKDGYLQLHTGRIAYDLAGDSAVSGYIRIVSESEEQDVKLYMGGLCESMGVLP